MPNIEVTPETKEKLSTIAGWEGITEGEVVSRLLERQSSPATPANDTIVAIYAVYEKQRVDGTFDRMTKTVTITSPPWSGEQFSKPSSAAMAVVKHYNAERNPNTNGWHFWRVSSTGQFLDSLRT